MLQLLQSGLLGNLLAIGAEECGLGPLYSPWAGRRTHIRLGDFTFNACPNYFHLLSLLFVKIHAIGVHKFTTNPFV